MTVHTNGYLCMEDVFNIAVNSLDSFGCYKTKSAIADNMIAYIIGSDYYSKGTIADIENRIYDFISTTIFPYDTL